LITAEQWYDKNPYLNECDQGDVIADIPYPFFPTIEPANHEEVWPLLRPLEQRNRSLREIMNSLPTKLVGRAAKDVTDRWSLPEGEYVIAGCRRMNVMIVSRSCALSNPKRKHFLVAPVVAVDDLEPEQREERKLKDLRLNNIPHAFYLPSIGGLRESYADVLRLVPIHRSFFPCASISGVLHARLSSQGTAALQSAMSDHFGMKFGYDHKDICPQGGRYSCSNCFHAGMKLQTRTFQEKRPFGACPGCEDDASWIKLPL